MAFNCFGEWGGRTVSPYLHAHSTHSWLLNGKENALFTHADFSSSLHELLNTHALKFRVLPVVCSPTGKNRAVFPHAGPPLSVLFLSGSNCFPTHRYSSVWGSHSELRAVRFHPRFPEKSHSRPQLYVLLTDRYGCVISVILMLRLELWFFPRVYCLFGTV